MRVDPSLVRSGQWWDHKVPPLIAAAGLTLVPAREIPAGELVVELCLFLVAAMGVAAFGHVVNDLADIRADALAGKPNQMATQSPAARTVIVLVTLAAGLLPWIWLPRTTETLGLLGAEVVLLIIYSVPPIRLKDRSALGVIADALYAYVLPILLTIAVFATWADLPVPPVEILVLATTWMLLMGLRGILWHQIGDLAHDRRAGVRTLATRIGADRGRAILGGMVVLELLAAGVTLGLVAAATGSLWIALVGPAYLLYRGFQMTVLWSEPVRPAAFRSATGRIRYLGFVILNEFVEKWLPLAALVALALDEPILWLAVLAQVALFENAAVEFLRRDLRELPDAVNRLAHERKSRRHIRRIGELRRATVATGPAQVTEEQRARRRWVFVVCGPELHVDTLRTAVAHLRPLTSLEIWVVTDSSRNVRPIDREGIDTVVDVATPVEMDDHQASIWLKTSIHRHLPPGEWCYLDSDIIAIRPGVEAVFEHRTGPVAFASDLTISVNQVDRFSPWAMTCECAGHGEVHSCGHLREQLALRLDVEVPGNWVHWNGGVFVFGEDSWDFLDLWHSIAIESFAWPEWRTRDQGALIATAWLTGNQDSPPLPAEFNFIADLGNGDLCLDPERGWALHPQGPWHDARFLHLYTSRLEDPQWDLGRDVEAPVIRQTLVRTHRWRRFEIRNKALREVDELAQEIGQKRQRFGQRCRNAYWATRFRLELYWARTRHLGRRLRLRRIRAAVRRRLGIERGTEPVFGDASPVVGGSETDRGADGSFDPTPRPADSSRSGR